MTSPRTRSVDVAVVGDGPAGSALAAALRPHDIEVVLIGRDDAWRATYGTWVDDLEGLGVLDGVDVWECTVPRVDLVTSSRRAIGRSYGVIDNQVLRSTLRSGVDHVVAEIDGIRHGERSSIDLADVGPIDARLVVDATGWPGRFLDPARSAARLAAVPRQTAIGVVLPEPPDGGLGRPTLMDWSVPAGASTLWNADDPGVPTFAYALPVVDGWLIEETVLASTPGVAPDRLLPRLAARLGTTPDALLDRAVRVERVDIPMGGPLPDRSSPTLAYGAAAAMIHPTTGYSLAASLRRAGPVAARLFEVLADVGNGADTPWEVVWPAWMRRTRALHDYGLEVLLALDTSAIASFFDAFFALDAERWAPYLRIDTPPQQIAGIMTRVFAAADWPLRRRLVSANPRAFARLLRP